MPQTSSAETGSDVFLSDLSERDKPWDNHRANASRVSKTYQDAGEGDRARRMNDCSKRLSFALEAAEGDDVGELRFRLRTARFCRQRLCPVCQWRRSLMWRARFFQALPKVLEAHPRERWVFLTLTVRNCPLGELRATIQAMNKAWDRLVKYKAFPAIGWVKSLEVTQNAETSEAHPHFHVLMMVKPSYFASKAYLSQRRWRELWQKAARLDYLPVVNVKAVKPVEGDSKPVVRGILETLKYGVKESDLIGDSAWLSELTKQLHKLRAVAPGGVLKQYLKEGEPEDLIHTDEDHVEDEILNQYPEIFFGWREQVKRYRKVDHSS